MAEEALVVHSATHLMGINGANAGSALLLPEGAKLTLFYPTSYLFDATFTAWFAVLAVRGGWTFDFMEIPCEASGTTLQSYRDCNVNIPLHEFIRVLEGGSDLAKTWGSFDDMKALAQHFRRL
jgi:hypothetical protein